MEKEKEKEKVQLSENTSEKLTEMFSPFYQLMFDTNAKYLKIEVRINEKNEVETLIDFDEK